MANFMVIPYGTGIYSLFVSEDTARQNIRSAIIDIRVQPLIQEWSMLNFLLQYECTVVKTGIAKFLELITDIKEN